MAWRFTVGEQDFGKRLDQLLKDNLPEISRVKLQKAIRCGKCLVDGCKVLDPASKTRTGQIVEFEQSETTTGIRAEDGKLKIIWQDGIIAVCDKPAGLTVHPCPSCPENTLAQRLLFRFPQLALLGGDRPGIAHRLDKDTSGLIVVALDELARLKLVEEFANREVEKEYLALVYGMPPETGECLKPVGRDMVNRTKMAVRAESHGGKAARSTWRRLWNSPDNKFSLLAVRIYTGRTHQIRVHLASLGFPILGDKLYAPICAREMAPRQMLHSWRLCLAHPASGQRIGFQTPPPEDFLQTIQKHATQMTRIVVTGNPGCGKSSFCENLEKAGLPVISADAIVAELYAKPGAISAWLEIRGYVEAFNADGSINKKELLQILGESQSVKEDFENIVHAYVRAEIEKFWAEAEKKSVCAAVAEIPLYFECGWNKGDRRRITSIGIHCPKQERWRRIMKSRGWSREKTEIIESWQMPEEKKMTLCDIVYNNGGDETMLGEAATNFLARLVDFQHDEKECLTLQMEKIFNEQNIFSGDN